MSDELGRTMIGVVPLRTILKDAVVGAGFPTPSFGEWAVEMKLATSGRVTIGHGESAETWTWDRDMLDMLTPEALLTVYERIKKLQG